MARLPWPAVIILNRVKCAEPWNKRLSSLKCRWLQAVSWKAFTYDKSGKEDVLEGTLFPVSLRKDGSAPERRNPASLLWLLPFPPLRGHHYSCGPNRGECGVVAKKFYLEGKKSDHFEFYIEPFLVVKNNRRRFLHAIKNPLRKKKKDR